MSTSSKWNQIGEEILDSVVHAVETGDFNGLSASVGDVINEAADSIGRGMDQFGRQIERQARARSADRTGAAGVWTPGSAHGIGGAPGRRDRMRYQAGARAPQTRQYPQVPARYRRFLPGQAAGPACLAVGIVGISFFGVATLATALTAVFTGMSIGVPVGLGIATLPFIGLTAKGADLNGRNHRFRHYVRVIGNRGYCAIEDLARAVGRRQAYVRKDLQDMLRRGYFLEGHMDAGETTLIVDNETYRQYEEAEEERRRREAEEERREAEHVKKEQEQPAPPDGIQKILTEGEAYISHIHECNDAIPGEVMSEKLAKLEDIMRRIFAQVKKQPESADELHKFMTYYLPTTTKLIDAYRDLDGQPAYGTNISNTKKEIEDTLDTINEAFENLFDSLFEDTAWDISSDISTMKVMLEQEGLTKNRDFQ